jgi:uncharacterized damage-inducible protein DinB
MEIQEVLAQWCEVRNGLIQTLDRFKESDLDFAPYEDSWSVGEIALHIAAAEKGWFSHIVTREFAEWPDDMVLESYPTVVAIKGILAEVHSRTENFLTSLDDTGLETTVVTPWGAELTVGWITWHVLEHEIHHRGELSLILGMLGREGLDV